MVKQKNKSIPVMPAAAQAASVLREEIRSGRYSIGERLANERVLAAQLGVSRETIRQSLKILNEERLVMSQHGRGTFVTNPNYSPKKDTQATLIGAMVYEKEYYFGSILNGAFSHATRRGYILATGINNSDKAENDHLEAFLQSGIRGLIFVPQSISQQSIKTYDRLLKEKIPVVILDKKIPGRYEDFVSVDDFQGMVLATQHLIDLGHTRIGYLEHDTPNDLPCQPERQMGFLHTCQQAGICLPQEHHLQLNQEKETFTSIHNVLLQKNRPTAFVCYNDYWAIRVYEVAYKLNLRIPQDLSIVGFDDSPLARSGPLQLTTVCPRPQELGKMLVDLLVNKIESNQPQIKRTVLIEPRLVVRETTAPPPPET